MSMKKEWFSLGSLILTLVIAITGVGIAWGKADLTTTNTRAEIQSVKTDIKVIQDQVSILTTGGAVNTVVVANILEQLTEIKKQLDEINKKIDRLNQEGFNVKNKP